jgi:hypothetical protein
MESQNKQNWIRLVQENKTDDLPALKSERFDPLFFKLKSF